MVLFHFISSLRTCVQIRFVRFPSKILKYKCYFAVSLLTNKTLLYCSFPLLSEETACNVRFSCKFAHNSLFSFDFVYFRVGAELANAVAEESTDEKFLWVSRVTSLKVLYVVGDKEG